MILRVAFKIPFGAHKQLPPLKGEERSSATKDREKTQKKNI